LDKIEWNLGNQLYKDNDRLVYIDIQEIQEPRLKEFKETQGAAINDYQVYLEEEWLSKLKTKYPVKVNQEEVDKLITKTK
jgi:peptidyl-prolyl cis-trans isomerase SurA